MTTQEPNPGKPPAPPREKKSATERLAGTLNWWLTAFLWITAVSLALIIGGAIWSAVAGP